MKLVKSEIRINFKISCVPHPAIGLKIEKQLPEVLYKKRCS